MSESRGFARLSREDCRACFTIIGFVYSPLLLMLGAAAIIGLS